MFADNPIYNFPKKTEGATSNISYPLPSSLENNTLNVSAFHLYSKYNFKQIKN